MTTMAGRTHHSSRLDGQRTEHILLHDDLGLLTVRRLRPWHRMLARCTATRLDRELAVGTSPEASARLAARAMLLTSVRFRRDLAMSVQRILVAAGEPAATMPAPAGPGHPPRIRLNRVRISQSAQPLARLAGQLARSGPVPVQGVAIVSLLLADGLGPLYHDACGDDLDDIIGMATRALSPSALKIYSWPTRAGGGEPRHFRPLLISTQADEFLPRSVVLVAPASLSVRPVSFRPDQQWDIDDALTAVLGVRSYRGKNLRSAGVCSLVICTLHLCHGGGCRFRGFGGGGRSPGLTAVVGVAGGVLCAGGCRVWPGSGRHGGPLCRRWPARWDFVSVAGRPRLRAEGCGPGPRLDRPEAF